MLATNAQSGVSSGVTSSLSLRWKEIVEPVRPFLDEVANRLVEQIDAFDPDIAPYAEYALTNQGKQLRPVLVALSAGAVGRLNETLVTAATIVEMVHLATLVHDDVMDAAELRRRRPTLAANWGNEVSVLVGDCLFAQAVKLAASFPTPDVCRAVATATNRVCSGEILQTHHRRNFALNRAEYFRILEMKTAELFALSCELGGFLAGGDTAQREALRRYGLALGTAYQIFDDCLDLFGSEAIVGKSLGTDLANGKLTLPLLVLVEHATVADQAQLREWVAHWDADRFPQVIEMLERYDAPDASRQAVHRFLSSARQSLEVLAASSSRRALTTLTEFLSQQTDNLGVGI
ncbi:MAG: polyprenyl synthetase family protein [Verrucomicrobiales bacterium]|nr:polyprenyl synthetase family protein [Verrucomicrobiales bacterium]